MMKACIIVKFEKGHPKNNKKKDKVIFSGQSLNCFFFSFFEIGAVTCTCSSKPI